MILSGLFTQNDILGLTMQAAAVRDSVISNNVANVDTPGFKKTSVRFESYLAEAIKNSKKTGRVDTAKLAPTLHVDHSDYSYRLDGNNVDIENEMVLLYKNQVKYDVLANSVINNYKRINTVFAAKF